MNQPYIKKKYRIIALMAISLLVLSVFVAYWLINQYQNEKKNLKILLHDNYYNTRSELYNKQIFEQIIQPILQNKDIDKLENIQFKDIELAPETKLTLIQSIINFLNENEQSLDKLYEYYNSVFPAPEPDENIHNLLITLNNYVFRAGIRHSYHYYYSRNNTKYQFIKYDETLLRRLFKLRLEYNKISVDVNWISKSINLKLSDNIIYLSRYNPDTKDEEVSVLFTDYEWHLIKTIFPQIGFIIVLLGLSAFALIFTYQSYIKQIRLSMLRTDFINNITHELKIPVATAKAALEALRSFGLKADPAITEEYLEMVANEMNRLDGLTARVLDHSKMEKHEKVLRFENIDMRTFTQRIVQSMNVLFKEKKIAVSYEAPQEDIQCSIDKLYAEGVIKNLIDNSMKYGKENVQISVKCWQENNHAYVTVSDNGPGIPKEYINKVFDKFFRVPKGDRHNVKGFGLGLSFAALVMKQHSGTIRVENLTDKGCRFTLKFPLSSQSEA